MKILAVEFSSEQRGVAIAADGRGFDAVTETAPRVTRAFGLIEEALKNAGLEREDVECIALGIGPGSYTGIRAAIALAQGWQLATGVKLLGIGSVECLAAQAQALGWFGKVSFVIDAQREELYFARYEISADSRREISALRLASLEEVRAGVSPGEIIAGPEVRRWFAEGRESFPGAETLARLAGERSDFIAGEKVEPIYLRETNFVKAPPPRTVS
jgi:tRNA threonylcarbamoyladenosine biosynthesis protein TsaB